MAVIQLRNWFSDILSALEDRWVSMKNLSSWSMSDDVVCRNGLCFVSAMAPPPSLIWVSWTPENQGRTGMTLIQVKNWKLLISERSVESLNLHPTCRSYAVFFRFREKGRIFCAFKQQLCMLHALKAQQDRLVWSIGLFQWRKSTTSLRWKSYWQNIIPSSCANLLWLVGLRALIRGKKRLLFGNR